MAEAKTNPVKTEVPLRRGTLSGRLVTIAVSEDGEDGVILEKKDVHSLPAVKSLVRPKLRRTRTGRSDVGKVIRQLMFNRSEHKEILGAWGLESISAMRSLLNPQRPYKFRLWAAPAAKTISTNVVAGSTVFSPLSLAEWSGILDSLFDEYRVDEVICHYIPVPQNGNNTASFPAGLSTASDFDSTVTPTSHVQVLTYADGKLHMMQLLNQTGTANQFGFTNKIDMYRHVSKIPRFVATAGVASAEWLDVGQAWPGSQLHFSNVLGTDGITCYHVFAEYHVSMRVRK